MLTSYLLLTHSYWRHVVLILLALATLRALIGMLGKQDWRSWDTQLVRFTLISVHIQFALGIVLYILRQAWLIPGYTTGHVIPAFLGVVAVTMANNRSKKATLPYQKFRWAFGGMFIGSLLILVAVFFALTR